MQFIRNIYDFNWRQLTVMCLPIKLRQPKIKALILSLTSSLASLYASFLNFKKKIEYELTITTQVVFLEKLLNDHFDYDQRRIVIIDPQYYEPLDLYLEEEGEIHGAFMPIEGEADAENDYYTEAEGVKGGVDFIVKTPNELIEGEKLMAQILSNYKLPTKKFKIVYE